MFLFRSNLYPFFLVILLITSCSIQEGLNPSRVLSLSPEVETPWLGFGYNQDPLDRNKDGHDIGNWDPWHWDLTKERINFIRPSFVRIVLYRHWFNPSGIVGQYNFNSPSMISLYQVLDYYKEKNIPVMTGLWQSTLDYNDNVPFYTTIGEGSFQKLQVDMFRQLYVEKGYKNITWYTPTNEPKGMGMDFQNWSLMMRNTYQGFEEEKLPTTIFTGADSWEEWTSSAAVYNKNELNAYDHHFYLNTGIDQLINGQVEEQFEQEVTNIRKIDPSDKPVFLSEVGFTTTAELDYWFVLKPIPSLNPTSLTYGVLAFDYGIQVARSGESGALAWSLDGYDYGKDPGMWNIAGTNGGITLRPWYYTWSLLCRYFPAGAKIHPINSNSRLIRGVAMEKTMVNKSHWSFAFVNWEEKEVEFQLKVSGIKGGDFTKFQFSELFSGDGTSLSLPKENQTIASLNDGFTIRIPAKGGVLITSMEKSPIDK
jgi:hypothetical protein